MLFYSFFLSYLQGTWRYFCFWSYEAMRNLSRLAWRAQQGTITMYVFFFRLWPISIQVHPLSVNTYFTFSLGMFSFSERQEANPTASKKYIHIPATKKLIQTQLGKHLKINVATFSYSHYNVLHLVLRLFLGILFFKLY